MSFFKKRKEENHKHRSKKWRILKNVFVENLQVKDVASAKLLNIVQKNVN